MIALIKHQGERTVQNINERGVQEEVRSLHVSGDALQDDEGRGMERRLKMGVLSTHLQTPAAASKHGPDGALTVAQRTPLMLAVPDWA